MSRDLVTYLSNNADVFASGTINRCIERVCSNASSTALAASSDPTSSSHGAPRNSVDTGANQEETTSQGDWWHDPRWLDESCANLRGELPSLEDVQVRTLYECFSFVLT